MQVKDKKAKCKAGISIPTVSRVSNGSPSVGRVVHEKGVKVTEDLGYTPNVCAGELKTTAF